MRSRVQGFEMEVTVDDGKPHLRVSFRSSGEMVLDTNALSIKGMENMAIVFTRAAKMAYTELDAYWRKEHAALRASRNHEAQ